MTKLFQEISKTIKTSFPNFGAKVAKHDHVTMDAGNDDTGLSETRIRSWIGDFDKHGNLWTFQFGRNQITMIDFDKVAADGNIVPQIFNFAKPMVTDPLWDVAYDAQTQSFYGVTRPNAAKANAQLFQIDISGVTEGGTPVFTTTELIGTKIHGVFQTGLPDLAFGAAMLGEDGSLHLAGTSEESCDDDAAQSFGGIYRVVRGDNAAILELVTGSPWCNFSDATADPHSVDPFVPINVPATELLQAACKARNNRSIAHSADAGGLNSCDAYMAGTGGNRDGVEIDPLSMGDDVFLGEARVKFDWLAAHLSPDASLSGIENVQRLCPDVDRTREHAL